MKTLKFALFAAICILYNSTGYALDDKINFESGTWEEAMAKAKKSKKLLFVDAFATWCGPCKMMDKNTFTNAEVAKYFNNNFVAYKIDVDTDKGGEISQKYGVTAMPTYLFVDGSSGNLVYKSVGYMEATTFIEVGKAAMEVPDLKARFAKGERSPEFTKKYLAMMAESQDADAQKLAKEYLDKLKNEDLLEESNFKIMTGYLKDTQSSKFKYYIKNIDTFNDKFADQNLSYLDVILDNLFSQATQNKDKTKIDEMVAIIKGVKSIIPGEMSVEDISKKMYDAYDNATKE